MRFVAPAPAFYAAAALAWGCMVYDTELVPGGAVPGAGNTGAETGKGGGVAHAGMSSNMTAGKSTGGTFGTNAGAQNGGTFSAPEAGASGEEGGTGGEESSGGGTGGSAGSGGKAGSGGTGGSAGSPNAVKCSEHPIPLKTTWLASASHESVGTGVESDGLYNPPIHAIDGNNAERWSSGQAQKGNEKFQVDFGVPVTLTEVTLQLFGNDTMDYPRGYAVRVADVDVATAPVLVSGVGTVGTTTITLPDPATGQLLLIEQTVDIDPLTKWWTIGELQVVCK